MAFEYKYSPTIELGADAVIYTLPEPPADKEIENYGLPINEQIFKRTEIPSSFEDIEYDDDGDVILVNQEQQSFYIREMHRRKHGHWYWIKGEKMYITGHHYFYLNYWNMGAETEGGYSEFRWGNALYFYMVDWVIKNPKVLGLLFLTKKRWGKTEVHLAIAYNIATTEYNRLCRLMSLKRETAKVNLFDKIKRSWLVMFEPFRPKHSGSSDPKDELKFGLPSKKGRKKVEQQIERQKKPKKRPLNSIIKPVETKISAVQGEKPNYLFVDEAASIIEMDLKQFVTTAREQLHLSFVNVIGKLFMPCTLEELNDVGVPAYIDLWRGSSPEGLEERVRTDSGLVRYYQPAWVALESFIDPWGFPMEEEAKKMIADVIEQSSPTERLKLRRQYSSTAEEAFGIVTESGLEEDTLLVLNETIHQLELANYKEIPYKIFEYAGEIKLEPCEPDKSTVWFSEKEVKPHVKYIIGIDGTGTDRETSNNSTDKSEFAIVVTKLYDGFDQRNYCDVATFSQIPLRLENCYKIAYCLWKHYNKYGKCRVMVEGNQAQAPGILAFFRNKLSAAALLHQLKNPGTDNFEVQNRIGTYRTAEIMSVQLQLLNKAGQTYGHNYKSIRLIKSLIKTGKENADLSDAFQMCILAWGDFAPDVEVKKEKKKRMVGEFDRQTMKWKWKEVEV